MQKHNNKKAVSYNKWGYIFLIPFMAVFVVFQLIPLTTTIYNSFFENYRSGLTQIGPNFIGFANFQKLISGGELLVYFKNTMIMWLMGFVPQIIVSLLLSAWFSDPQLRLRCTRFFKTVIYLPNLIGGLQMFDVPQVLTNSTGDPMRSTMTLIMYLNKHLFSKNYGMAGALSVLMFLLTGVLSILVFKLTNERNR